MAIIDYSNSLPHLALEAIDKIMGEDDTKILRSTVCTIKGNWLFVENPYYRDSEDPGIDVMSIIDDDVDHIIRLVPKYGHRVGFAVTYDGNLVEE